MGLGLRREAPRVGLRPRVGGGRGRKVLCFGRRFLRDAALPGYSRILPRGRLPRGRLDRASVAAAALVAAQRLSPAAAAGLKKAR